MAVTPPPGMKQATWEYLVRFTTQHEWPVLHMYNNKRAAGDKQDVTCGIGILLASPDAACKPEIKRLFKNKVTGQAATDDELREDWKTAAATLRTDNNLESTPDGKGYADKCKLTMDEALVREYSQQVLTSKLAEQRRPGVCDELAGFADMPAQAQVAIASFNYGYAVTSTKLFRAALGSWDFDEAGKQSWLKGLSPRKVVGHRVLFWNAARIVEQNLDFDQVPLGVDPPGPLLEWKPWTQTEIDLDSGASTVVTHAKKPRTPDAAK